MVAETPSQIVDQCEMNSNREDCAHHGYPELETEGSEKVVPLQFQSVWGLHEDAVPGIRVSVKYSVRTI